MKERQKEYRDQNREQIKECHEQNRDKIQEQKKEYRQQNIEKIKEKIECACGGRYRHSDKVTHFKTKKHQAFINNQAEQ